MRTLVAVVVLAICQVATATADDDRKRERIFRALSIVDALGLDDVTIGRLFPVLSGYEQDREKLVDELGVLSSLIGKTTDAAAVDRLLDRTLATQRALIAIDVKLVVRLRQLLPAEQAARARVMIFAAAAAGPAPEAEPVDTVAVRSGPARGHDPDALFPPRSRLLAMCDPFAQMHRCPN